MAEKSRWGGYGVTALVLALQFLPILAVALNAFATDWDGTVLPAGYTTQWAEKMLADPRFAQALTNSLIIAGGSLLVSAMVCVPAILVAHCYFPLLDRWLGALVILPFAVPGIVLALGLLKLYSGNYGVVLNGTPWVLIFGYVPLGASLYYVPMKNNLRALPVQEILDAGYLVGASDFAIIMRVILPCVVQGVVVGLIMNFTLVISEFVYANLLVGGQFPTLQIFMYVLRGGSGRLMSFLVTVYFLVALVATTVVTMILMQRKDAA